MACIGRGAEGAIPTYAASHRYCIGIGIFTAGIEHRNRILNSKSMALMRVVVLEPRMWKATDSAMTVKRVREQRADAEIVEDAWYPQDRLQPAQVFQIPFAVDLRTMHS